MAETKNTPTLPTLAACPFCGEAGPELFSDAGAVSYNVACPKCNAEGPSGETCLEVVEKWNARGTPEARDLQANPLIQNQTADTLYNVRALMTWWQWHQRDPDSVPSDETAEKIGLGEYHLRQLVIDALDYVSARVDASASREDPDNARKLRRAKR